MIIVMNGSSYLVVRARFPSFVRSFVCSVFFSSSSRNALVVVAKLVCNAKINE